MRIIVLDYAADSGGALSILNDFYDYILKNAPHHEWVFVVSTAKLLPYEHVKIMHFPDIKKSWLNRIIWEKRYLKKVIYEEKADIVFSLQNLIVPGLNLPQIVYVHQSIPFQNVKNFSFCNHEERLLAIYQKIIGRKIWWSIKNANAVIVQSHWMKEAILKKLCDCRDKVFVIRPSVDLKLLANKNLVSSESATRNNVSTFFYPAGALTYKNFDCLIKAAYRLLENNINDFRIVLTLKGDENSYAARIKKMATGLGERVLFAGKMSREEVFKMYQSSVLVFPSYIETFGLPLLEATLLGSIVLASDCPFSREILRGYQNAYYFDPFNVEELSELMSRVISGSIVATHNVESGVIQDVDSWKEVLSVIENRCKIGRKY